MKVFHPSKVEPWHAKTDTTTSLPSDAQEGGGGMDATPHKVFLSFFLEDKTSVPDVFSSFSFILRTYCETNLVMVSCYGYEL